MIILSHIFWTFGLVFFISSFGYLFNFKRVNYALEWYIRFKEITKRAPKRDEFRNEKDYNIFVNRTFLGLLELIWILFGFFTSYYLIFLSILVLLLVISFGLDKWRFSKVDNLIRFLFVLVRCVSYIVMFIYNYHF